MPIWVRWTMLLPLSVGTYFLINLVFNLIGMVFNFVGSSPYNQKFFTHLVSPYMGGLYCISWPLESSPGRKRIVGLFLSAIWMAAFGAWTFVGVRLEGWSGLLPPVLSTLGVLYAFSEIRQEYVEPKPNLELEKLNHDE